MWTWLPILVSLTSADPASAGPLHITTDSLEYCSELASRLAAMPGARQEPSQTLGAEGRQLCRDGHVRTGVAKLRRALRAAQGR